MLQSGAMFELQGEHRLGQHGEPWMEENDVSQTGFEISTELPFKYHSITCLYMFEASVQQNQYILHVHQYIFLSG